MGSTYIDPAKPTVGEYYRLRFRGQVISPVPFDAVWKLMGFIDRTSATMPVYGLMTAHVGQNYGFFQQQELLDLLEDAFHKMWVSVD